MKQYGLLPEPPERNPHLVERRAVRPRPAQLPPQGGPLSWQQCGHAGHCPGFRDCDVSRLSDRGVVQGLHLPLRPQVRRCRARSIKWLGHQWLQISSFGDQIHVMAFFFCDSTFILPPNDYMSNKWLVPGITGGYNARWCQRAL